MINKTDLKSQQFVLFSYKCKCLSTFEEFSATVKATRMKCTTWSTIKHPTLKQKGQWQKHVQWNLSNPTHQGNVSDFTGYRNTQVLFMLTELLWDHQFLSENSGVGLHRFHCIMNSFRFMVTDFRDLRKNYVFVDT